MLCGLPMYVKFAGSAVVALRRWMDAPEIDPEDEAARSNYLDNIYTRHKSFHKSVSEELRLRHRSKLKLPGRLICSF